MRSFYDPSFLLGELKDAAMRMDSASFGRFHADSVAKRVPGFSPDQVICVGERVNDDLSVQTINFRINHEAAEQHIEVYRKHTDRDGYRRLKIFNKGRFLNFEQMTSAASCQGPQPMAEAFAKLAVSDAMSCCYPIANFKNNLLTMNYLFQSGNKATIEVTTHEVEYLSIPFLFGWLLIADYIDAGQFEEWTEALTELTPMQVCILRDLVNTERYSAAGIADKYSISRRTLESHINGAHEAKGYLLDAHDDVGGKFSRTLDLINLFSFLRFVGEVKLGTLQEPSVN
ncbi:MAG: hypothetical protein AAF401_06115 [Pseudomonadota bacterium]